MPEKYITILYLFAVSITALSRLLPPVCTIYLTPCLWATSILSESINKIEIQINEEKIENFNQSLIGIFDPDENNFSLNMWSQTDGMEIKKTLNRISKLKISKISEDMLFEVLFTNSYPPQKN